MSSVNPAQCIYPPMMSASILPMPPTIIAGTGPAKSAVRKITASPKLMYPSVAGMGMGSTHVTTVVSAHMIPINASLSVLFLLTFFIVDNIILLIFLKSNIYIDIPAIFGQNMS